MARPLCRWGIAVLMLAMAGAARPQSEGPAFEVASVKEAESPGSPAAFHGGPGTDYPGQWTATSSNLSYLVYLAWELDSYRLSGPQAMDSAKFDITAKLPPGTSKHDFHRMLQRLLLDRIRLVMHHEPKVMEHYEMVIAKGGSKLRAAEAAAASGTEDTSSVNNDGRAHLAPGIPRGLITQNRGGIQALGRMQSTADIARNFASVMAAKLPVIDKTGLTGMYDYDVLYSYDFHTTGVDSVSTPGEDFVSVVERELGLKLQSKKGPVDVVVIDSFLKTPTAN